MKNMNTMRQLLMNKRGIMLIWFYLLIVMLMITGSSLYALSFQESRLIVQDQTRDKAFYLAEAGLDRKLQELKIGNVANVAATPLGAGTYAATYDAAASRVTGTGTVNGVTQTVTAVVQKQFPPGIRAALSTGSGVTVNGNINIDGRDHDTSGNLTGAPGTFGISSAGAINQGGSSDIGGSGVAPANPANPASTDPNSSSPNIFTTPEEALGLTPGSLDQYKTATPPAGPYSGVIYVTGDWTSVNLGTVTNPGTGVLIVHNDTGTATLKNVRGYFKGLIIADKLTHVNATAKIIGGIIIQNQAGNSVGNGNADILYSSQTLSNLPTSNYQILSWEDTQNYPDYTYS